MNRRGFLRNLGSLVGALSVGLTVFKPQERKKVVFTTKPAPDGRLVGYKGAQFFEAGVIYAPYIPLYQTCMINAKPDPEFQEKIAKRYVQIGLTNRKNMLQLS